jgi:DNA-directed RNA polymerase I, II, and III subunit RPABC1
LEHLHSEADLTLPSQAIMSVRTELGIDVEAFQEAELLVNITKHVLVPHHSVLTQQEKKELLAK